MAYIKFEKKKLINLEYALKREQLRTNKAGAYCATTILNCNTRKYHGLLIVPQPQFGNVPHVLLSSLHESVIQKKAIFNLGIHKYNDHIYSPKGHKYVRDFALDPASTTTWRVGGVVLKREMLFSSHEDLLMMKYTLLEAHSETRLRFTPFLAFRNLHSLSKVNNDVNKDFLPVANGCAFSMYHGYTPLFIQFSKSPQCQHQPDWYYNIEYTHEKNRGYEYLEDLYTPGSFEIAIQKGESIIVAAGTQEIDPETLNHKFETEIKKRLPINDFASCLRNAAQQFLVFRDGDANIIAGYPWHSILGRDTFMAMPGLLLARNKKSVFIQVMDTMIKRMKGAFFPNAVYNNHLDYHSVDTQLWFFWALQKYVEHSGENMKMWNRYKNIIQTILNAYREGTAFQIKMQEDGLLFAGEPGSALTWMNARTDGVALSPRVGCPVEVNALWYNAILFSIELAEQADDTDFVQHWQSVASRLKNSFIRNFWDKTKGYLADFTFEDFRDWSVRPNMVLAASLPYSPLDDEQKKQVLDIVEKALLTPRGLRTLSPRNYKYKGFYKGNAIQREAAVHHGTVHPWLLGHFAEAWLQLYGQSGLEVVKNLYEGFGVEMQSYGLGTIAELFDGNPPHRPGGAISMATSVAELLRINQMISKFKKP